MEIRSGCNALSSKNVDDRRATRRTRDHAYVPRLGVSRVVEPDQQIEHAEPARGPRGPFDQQQGIVGHELAQAEIVDLVCARDPVEIAVMDRTAREEIRLDERVGRTAHRAIVTERTQESRDQRRLAGTELALETDEPGPPI